MGPVSRYPPVTSSQVTLTCITSELTFVQAPGIRCAHVPPAHRNRVRRNRVRHGGPGRCFSDVVSLNPEGAGWTAAQSPDGLPLFCAYPTDTWEIQS